MQRSKTPLKIWQQLALSFGLAGAASLLLAFTGWSQLKVIQQHFEEVVDQTLPALTALSEVNDRLHRVRAAELGHLNATTMPAKEREEKTIQAAEQDLAQALQAYGAAATGQADTALQQALAASVAGFNGLRGKFLQMSNSAAGAEGDRLFEANEFFTGPSQQGFQQAYEAVQNLWQLHAAQAGQARDRGRADIARAVLVLAAVAAASIVLSSLLGWVIARRLNRQLGAEPAEVAQVARRIAAGDLSAEIARRGAREASVMSSMVAMQAQLRELIAAMQGSAQNILVGASEIAAGNLDLSARTEQQAASVQATHASVEDLNAMVQQGAEQAGAATALTTTVAQGARHGGLLMQRVVDAMAQITDKSRKVGDVLAVIDNIAARTNILAINASVEAARAGQQGRGFAVVADEVRSLALRCGEASREIRALISDSSQSVDEGAAQVKDASAAVSGVVSQLQALEQLVGEMRERTSGQHRSIAQIRDAVSMLDDTAQRNAALVEEASAAADSLAGQAQSLVANAARFRIEAAAPQLLAR